MSSFLLSQTIAAIAFVLGVVSFQSRSRRAFLYWISGSAFVNAIHFVVLARPAPAALYVITGSRSLIAAFTTSRKVLYVLLAVILVGFYFSYRNPLGFVGLLATLLATVGSFQRSHQVVRIFFMLAATTWMIHNILAGTPVAALMEATFLASNLIGYWRFRRSGTAAADPGTHP
jgi:hypothetical protein